MREILSTYAGQRLSFRATFKRLGVKDRRYNDFLIGLETPRVQSVLLVDVRLATGDAVADHVWLNYTKGFQKLGRLVGGERIAFDARVFEYWKGYEGYADSTLERDWSLTRPTKVRLIQPETRGVA